MTLTIGYTISSILLLLSFNTCMKLSLRSKCFYRLFKGFELFLFISIIWLKLHLYIDVFYLFIVCFVFFELLYTLKSFIYYVWLVSSKKWLNFSYINLYKKNKVKVNKVLISNIYKLEEMILNYYLECRNFYISDKRTRVHYTDVLSFSFLFWHSWWGKFFYWRILRFIRILLLVLGFRKSIEYLLGGFIILFLVSIWRLDNVWFFIIWAMRNW